MPTTIIPTTPIIVRPLRSIPTIRPSAPLRVTPTVVLEIKPVRVALTRIRPTAATSIAPVRTETVRPPERGAWDERGWTRRRDGDKDIYEGVYQVGDRRFRGRIEVGRRRRIQAFVHNPPREIRRHRHHACFQQYGSGTDWFILHWQRSPRNVDEALLYFEQILDESINNR